MSRRASSLKAAQSPTKAEIRAGDKRMREVRIRMRLTDIERRIIAIRADPRDVRCRPDVRRRKDGGTYHSDRTDLDSILRHVENALEECRGGEWAAAQDALWDIESRWRAVTARVDAPDLERGRGVKKYAKEGGEARGRALSDGNTARNNDMAREFKRRRPGSKLSDTALKISIGREQGLGRSASIEAIKQGLKKLSGQQSRPND